jgi:tetratricopeptide (TPR) repeat protein
MYNLKFDEALRTVEAAKDLDRNDPLPWVAQVCAILFREFDRLHILRSDLFVSEEKFSSRSAYSWDAAHKAQFEEAAGNGEKLARDLLGRDKNDIKALFALALIIGLRGDASAMITKSNLAALGYIKAASEYSDRLLAISPGYYDAYVGTGLAKYIVGGKPAVVRWILRIDGVKGDREAGIRELRLAAEHGRFLAPFAQIVLAFDDLKYKNKGAARKKLEALHNQFPGNPLFVEEMAKCDQSSPGATR